MPTLNDVLSGSLAQAVQVQQIIDALKGTPNKGVPVALVSLNDANNYALTVQNDDPTNSRALSVLKADGTNLITADANGVTLGAPVNLPAGSLNGTQLANASVSNAKLGPDVARANLLTNGGLEIWQRGNGPFTAQSAFTADRWQIVLGGTSTISVQRAASPAPPSTSAGYSLNGTYTHNATSFIEQKISDAPFILAGQTVTLSMMVTTTTPNAVLLRLYDGTNSAFSSAHPGSGGFQKLSVTLTVGAAATSLLADVVLQASCAFYVDNAMLVVGSQSADYVPMHPADDLARCLRYYELLVTAIGENLLSGGCYAATNANFAWRYRVPKAVTPTVTVSAPTAFACQTAAGGTVATTNLTAAGTTVSTTTLTATVASGLVAGNSSLLSSGSGSQVVSEANP